MIIGSVREHHEKVSSTNSVAAVMLSDEKPAEGTIITASFQKKGRGQTGNGWESEADKNLLMSIILYPVMVRAEDQFILSQMVSLALYDLVRKETSGVRIKWPNDIYVKDDKIAGILIENSVMGNSITSCIAGIGLNVNQQKWTGNAPNPVSLTNITGKAYDNATILNDLAQLLDERYRMIIRKESSRLSEDYHSALYRRASWHRYIDKDGEFSGMIESATAGGMLRVWRENGISEDYAFKEIDYIL
ncbi:MAG TPA: biotin--[acetyl-CoA-carboxylase] ligase [Bacteroidales bacterium]|nr:biotin--[acetyl-CoA-carboxylase] ligase [Bacteroidales bacterium]